MNSSVESHVLAVSGNYAVVKLDQRQFPCILMQGDTFNCLIRDVEEAMSAAKESQEAMEILGYMIQDLKAVRSFYEKTLTQNGARIPY
jgi:hypothetical protein